MCHVKTNTKLRFECAGKQKLLTNIDARVNVTSYCNFLQIFYVDIGGLIIFLIYNNGIHAFHK